MCILAHIFRNLKYLPNNSDTACFSIIIKITSRPLQVALAFIFI